MPLALAALAGPLSRCRSQLRQWLCRLVAGLERLWRYPRASLTTRRTAASFIATHYETLTQQSKRAVYLLLTREAEQRQIAPPSYTTFRRRITRRSRADQPQTQRATAAAQEEPWFWELEQTTPRHGDRPWDVVHIDHTQFHIELVSTRTGRPLSGPWATFLTDAVSRRLVAVYLTFDPPSSRSCLMTLRDCVWRYERLPYTLIVDGGADFRILLRDAAGLLWLYQGHASLGQTPLWVSL